MSDTFLRLIPQEPRFVPSREAEEAAVYALRMLFPTAKVSAHRFSEIEFVDQGSNFERVVCPNCKQEIAGPQWLEWVEESYSKSRLKERTVKLLCCGVRSDLNDLIYEWPAGFAMFKLEVWEPGGWLSLAVMEQIKSILGCRIRQILTHY